MPGHKEKSSALTGRIRSGPHELLRAETLTPQLEFELTTLLPHYVTLERVLLLEYLRMGLLDRTEVAKIDRVLAEVDADTLAPHAHAAMSDLAFSLERYVSERVGTVPPSWHVDRSRNDLQSTAQSMYGRERLLQIAEELRRFGRAAIRLAGRHVDDIMPGYTHLQPAQVISPGFYLCGISEQVLHALHRLELTYHTASSSAMGAGAMAGQELTWDRDRMARLLGCGGVHGHSLRAVAAREWPLEATAEFSLLSVALSRFVTDLMMWGSGAYAFIDLPDEWSGISSAMPQKKNFPVLERIRARLGRLGSGHLAVLLGQRNTSFSNTVEVSKEASSGVSETFDTMLSVLILFTAVLDNLTFRTERMRVAAEADYLGGFTLANLLTLRAGVPWRESQVLAGRYIVAAVDARTPPTRPDGTLLERLASEAGHRITGSAELLAEAFDVDRGLVRKRTPGATGPEAVREMLVEHEAALDVADGIWSAFRSRIAEGEAEIAHELADCHTTVPKE